MDRALRIQIRDRAGNHCEYCQIPQEADPFYTFPADHIIARQHRGTTTLDNLALSCYRCNIHKGPNIASVDPDTGEIVPLFHPRRDTWSEHFEWHAGILVGLTQIGRATVELLVINHPGYVLLRETLIDEGVFPPQD